jgi:methyl-accepting chemotaxis protein
MNTQIKAPHESLSSWRQRLRVTLNRQMFLIAFVPLGVVAVAVISLLTLSGRNLERDILSEHQETVQVTIGTTLQNDAQTTMRAIDAYMRERLDDVVEWANVPLVRRAAQASAAQAVELGLTTLTEAQVESKMDATRALSQDAELAAYLRGLSERRPAFVEMFFTDAHGFTVAYHNQPSDFVQAGETWWDTAWERGSYVGHVQYDDSAGRHAIELAVRIDGSAGQPLGVFKAVLSIQAIQDLVAETASRVPQSTVRLFTQQGDQIADTASQNDPATIMTAQGNLLERNWSVARRVLDQQGKETGDYLLDQQNQAINVGYAFSAPGSYYDNVPGFDGFAWTVAVSQVKEGTEIPKSLSNVEDKLDQASMNTLIIVLTSMLLAAVFALAATAWASRSIARPIAWLAHASRRIRDGDLSTTVQVEHRNEIGELEAAFQQMTAQLRQILEHEHEQRDHLQSAVADYTIFAADVAMGQLATRLDLEDADRDDPLVVLGLNLNDMVDNLRHMTAQIRNVAQGLSLAISEILSATTQQVAGANAQSAAINQTTTSVDEVKAIAEQSVARAQQVADTAQRTVEVSRSGRQAVQQTIASMGQIKARVEGIAENILALSEQTQQIGEIIATVNDIAAQSNILALNASVEAARAGEHGKGFAVVAVEVRNLAEQSRQATAQIKAILSDIQKATNATVMATEEGTKGVDEGIRLAAQTQGIIDQLAAAIDESAQVAMQLVAAGQQQASGVEQVALAMEDITRTTAQSLSSTHQAEMAAQKLDDLARGLTETVGQYQL